MKEEKTNKRGQLKTEEEKQESIESWKPKAELWNQGWLASGHQWKDGSHRALEGLRPLPRGISGKHTIYPALSHTW